MRTPRVPWSWTAFLISALPLGGVLMFGMYFAQLFRRGLDADMSMMMFSMPLHEYLAYGVVQGVICLPFLALGLGLANLTGRPARNFYLIAAGVPSALYLASQAYWIIGAALEEPMNIVPFEANNVFYLPNWLTLATIIAALTAGVWSYNRVLRAQRSPAAA